MLYKLFAHLLTYMIYTVYTKLLRTYLYSCNQPTNKVQGKKSSSSSSLHKHLEWGITVEKVKVMRIVTRNLFGLYIWRAIHPPALSNSYLPFLYVHWSNIQWNEKSSVFPYTLVVFD